MKIRKYFLSVILLFCPIVHGNSLWQNLADTSSSYARYCVCFAHYTKDNPLFAVSMVAAISGMTACFAKFVSYTHERKSLEQQNSELNKIVVATEHYRDKKQKLLGHNWSVSVNYSKALINNPKRIY